MDVVQWVPAALGLLVGFLLALTGAGGAILSVPLLVFGVPWNVMASNKD